MEAPCVHSFASHSPDQKEALSCTVKPTRQGKAPASPENSEKERSVSSGKGSRQD